jgi:hypothetical protein
MLLLGFYGFLVKMEIRASKWTVADGFVFSGGYEVEGRVNFQR